MHHNAKQPAIYIMSNRKHGTLYIGVTSNLIQRVWQHKNHQVKGFTERYNLERLVWYQQADSIAAAITREKQLKNWKRDWKVRLIEDSNPSWDDLYPSIIG